MGCPRLIRLCCGYKSRGDSSDSQLAVLLLTTPTLLWAEPETHTYTRDMVNLLIKVCVL